MSFLRSVRWNANHPPSAQVSRPTTMSRVFQSATSWKAGEKRISRKMPAFTTAAACR